MIPSCYDCKASHTKHSPAFIYSSALPVDTNPTHCTELICLVTVYAIYELQWSASYISSCLCWTVLAYTDLTIMLV